MKNVFPIVLVLALLPLAASAVPVASPNGRLVADFTVDAGGAPRYTVALDGKPVLLESALGLVRDDADFSTGLVLEKSSRVTSVRDRYELLVSKRRQHDYRANRREFALAAKDGRRLDIVFQVSDDGVAFRYRFPEKSAEVRTLLADRSTFRFPAETVAWLQAMQVSKTGFEKTNPAYEEYYRKEIPAGTPSPLGQGWVYPALFRSGGGAWAVVSEGSLGRGDAATRLAHLSPNGEYAVAFPDARETLGGRPVNPASTLPWTLPWRFVAVGDLKTIVESTLGTDLAAPAAVKPPAGSVRPGKSSWSWVLLGDNHTVYDTQKRFIDYSADMGWAYCLVDADWDRKIGYEKMRELAAHARAKNVGLLLWYNSAGDWNTVKYTPRDKLLTRESRLAEFARLRDIGIKGVKIDFFGGDGRPVIDYYLDILEDSAPFGLLINFHGATLPRGWQRTYPHLMTVEAVRGFENFTFQQRDADQHPSHAAMMPFTRNLFDPMDFTPMALDRLPGKKVRRTTAASELAQAVLFTSGIQHYAEIPEGMAKMPDYVTGFVRAIPSVWDEIRFIEGYPGKHVVLARRAGKRWFVAGLNGEPVEKTLSLDLSGLRASGEAELVIDGDPLFERRVVPAAGLARLDLTLRPHGGFVLLVR